MKCANCYEEIDFNASVCPHCKNDTTASREAENIRAKFLVCGMLIGLVGGVALVWDFTKTYESILFWFLPRSPIYGRIFAGFLGALVGTGAGWLTGLPWYLPALKAAKADAINRADIQIMPLTPAQKSELPTSTDARLKALGNLKEQGLISEEEYLERRKEIISLL